MKKKFQFVDELWIIWIKFRKKNIEIRKFGNFSNSLKFYCYKRKGSVDRCSQKKNSNSTQCSFVFIAPFFCRHLTHKTTKMNVQLTNTTFELRITPTKRKREELKERKPQQNNKENQYVFNNFMEVKSIADLLKPKDFCNNAFEVVQKPPKKKNRKHSSDENCFVNPALNLNGPEHVVNPFEVKRKIITATEPVQHCFENNGFTIRGEDRKITNPYEIARDAPVGGANEGKFFYNKRKKFEN